MTYEAASDGGPQSKFERDCNDPKKELVYDFEPDSQTLVIAFGGFAGRLGIPSYEFFQSVSSLAVKRMFLRDRRSCWYQRGIDGVGEGVDGLRDALAELISESGVERTVTVGNSGGGYAALLFGHLLDVHEVHSFVPMTNIDPDVRYSFGDQRCKRETGKMIERGWLDPRYADLRAVLLDGDESRTGTSHVYYSRHVRVDRVHAERLRDAKHVVLHERDERGHSLIRQLRDKGELQPLLERAALNWPGTDR
jgi:pimeloyl-ACP methyl ester carboxylesterase